MNAMNVVVVMVVSDSEETLCLLDDMLREEGYRVLIFRNGGTALEAATDRPPDLVLLDAYMRGADGFELCRRMKAAPGLSAVPVILVGISDEKEERLRVFGAGGADYASAPLNSEEILAKVWMYTTFNRLKREFARSERMSGGEGSCE